MPLSSHKEIQILHVDDDPSITDLTETFLEREDDHFAVQTATSADEGLEMIADRPPDCVVSDYNMPGMDGIEFLQAVREEYPDLPFILFTGKGSETVASDAIAAGITDYLQKGSGTEQYELLANRIRNAVRARRETERADRQEKLMRLTEFAGDTGGFELDRESNTILLTAGTRRIIGRPDTFEITLEEALELFHPDDCEGIQHTLDRAFETGEELHDRWRLQPDNGDERLLDITITPVVENGEVTRLRGSGHDITEKEERRREREEYGTIIKALSDAVYVLDEEGRFTYVNDEFVELVGYDRETILGSTPSLIKDETAVEKAEQQLGQLLSSDGPDTVAFEVTIHARDGDRIVCEDHMGVLPYEGDKFNGSVGTLRDITDRVERERETQRQNERLEEFASIVSHDLRNPLCVADGRLELIRDECASDHIDDVAQALDRMDALIEDLLTLAREGSRVDEIEQIGLANVAKNSWQTVNMRQATLDVDTSQVIEADRSRIKQLFENLYRNAIEHGGDDVTVSVGAIDDGFYVADTGPGIPKSDREDVFEAGYSTNEDGTGFGLRIVKQIADAHGWEIIVTESKGGGARFEISGVETSE